MALGIGQNESTLNQSHFESVPFCKLFETQQIFQQNVGCLQESVRKFMLLMSSINHIQENCKILDYNVLLLNNETAHAEGILEG